MKKGVVHVIVKTAYAWRVYVGVHSHMSKEVEGGHCESAIRVSISRMLLTLEGKLGEGAAVDGWLLKPEEGNHQTKQARCSPLQPRCSAASS